MPTVGLTSEVGAIGYSIAAREVNYCKFTLTGSDASSYLSNIHAYVANGSGVQQQWLCVWADNAGVPGTLIGYGKLKTSGAGLGWYDVDQIILVGDGKMPNGDYWLGHHAVLGGGNGQPWYHNATDPGYPERSQFPYDTATPPNPGAPTIDNGSHSMMIYATVSRSFGNRDDRTGEAGAIADFLRGTVFTLSESAVINRISGQARATSGTATWRYGIWAIDGGASTNRPGLLLAMTPEISTAITTLAEYGADLTTPINLLAGDYVVGVWSKNALPSWGIHDSLGVEHDGGSTLAYQAAIDYRINPWSNYAGPFSRKYGFYADYDAEAPGKIVRLSGSKIQNGNATTIVVNRPTGTASGDLLVCQIAGNRSGARTITPPAGWTRVESQITPQYATNDKMDVFYRIADGTEAATFTFTVDTTTWLSSVCVAYRGTTSFEAVGASTFDLGPVVGSYTSLVMDEVTPDAAHTEGVYIACGILGWSAAEQAPTSQSTDYLTAGTMWDANVNIEQIQTYKPSSSGAASANTLTMTNSATGYGSIVLHAYCSSAGPGASWTQQIIPAKFLPNGVQHNPAVYTAQRLSPLGVAVNESASTLDELTALCDAYDASL